MSVTDKNFEMLIQKLNFKRKNTNLIAVISFNQRINSTFTGEKRRRKREDNNNCYFDLLFDFIPKLSKEK